MSADDNNVAKWFRHDTPIEAGWQSFREHVAGQWELDQLRMVFFSGAVHLWCLLAQCVDLDDKEEGTDNDDRWTAIDDELKAFTKEMLADPDKQRET